MYAGDPKNVLSSRRTSKIIYSPVAAHVEVLPGITGHLGIV